MLIDKQGLRAAHLRNEKEAGKPSIVRRIDYQIVHDTTEYRAVSTLWTIRIYGQAATGEVHNGRRPEGTGPGSCREVFAVAAVADAEGIVTAACHIQQVC